MCGIAGLVDFKATSTEAMLHRMNDSLSHRGPDGEGSCWVVENTFEATVGITHRRLSIIDLSEGGKQPMQYKHFVITFNGEIYNYQEIKDELIQKGHVFHSTSDTEVILHAFEAWGTACLDRFVGMFAFVIFDQKKKHLYAFRDRAGVKPLFFYWHDGLFLFSSELKAFHQHPGFKKALNLQAVAAFMQYGYVPTPHCIFEHCQKLQPGHYLEFSLAEQQLNIKKYWDVYDYYNQPKLKINFQEAKSETEQILQKAFDYRMVADVPVGVFLSGGYDSTCVTALLQKNSIQKIKTFTIGVADAKLDEAPYAKAIAARLGTDHTEIYCHQNDALDIVPELPFYYDEPFGDYSAIPTTLVSRLASKQVTVALSADAGDEVFAGYNRYDYEAQLGWLTKVPSLLKSAGAKFLHTIPSHAIPYFSKHPLFKHRYEKLKLLLRDSSPKSLMKNLTAQFFDSQLQALFLVPIQVLPTYFDPELKPAFSDGISQMMATDYQTYLLDDILQKVDRATMSVSLEGREPFLDQNIIQWAAQLPTEYKYYKGNKKYILKEIVHQYIPKDMMDRPKMGFSVPITDWLRKELKELLETHINESSIKNSGVFNWSEVKHYKTHFLAGKEEYGYKIWYFLMFQMWYAHWMK